VLIIGIGNPDRGDDAAGILVVRRLQQRGINAVEHTGATLNLLEVWAASNHVIVVDAVVSGAAPGSIQVWDPWEVSLKSAVFRVSTHEFGLADTIELARALKRLPSWMKIYGIEATRFEAGTQPAQEVVLATEQVAEEIQAMMIGARLIHQLTG
jgi:hydrogenase maturation protease